MNNSDHNSRRVLKCIEAKILSGNTASFRDVKDSNVLIYFPHGFGDFVQFSYILPLLESSNHYWMTRYGDDYTIVMDGNLHVTPLFLGIKSTLCDAEALYGNHPLGIDIDKIDGSIQQIEAPLALTRYCTAHGIDTVYVATYPEIWGYGPFPYHTKARHMLSLMTNLSEETRKRLDAPLRSTINFVVPPAIQNWVEAQLHCHLGLGDRKLCIISQNGHTSIEKNWGHLWREDFPGKSQIEGEECRDFMRLMLKHDPNWTFLVMEDRLLKGEDTICSKELSAYSYAQVFGANLPFGLAMKACANVADLAVGVPTGPHHLAMAKDDLPVVGIWLAHMPSWYDEPKQASIHVISRNVIRTERGHRPGSFLSRGELIYRALEVDTRIITGEQAFEASRILLD